MVESGYKVGLEHVEPLIRLERRFFHVFQPVGKVVESWFGCSGIAKLEAQVPIGVQVL